MTGNDAARIDRLLRASRLYRGRRRVAVREEHRLPRADDQDRDRRALSEGSGQRQGSDAADAVEAFLGVGEENGVAE